MKICVTTFYNICHPGAVLQAYALCRTLNELGHDARLVQFPATEPSRKRSRPTPQSIYAQLTGVAKKRVGYAAFVAGHCPLTEQAYGTFQALEKSPPVADAYICGSDQIWNPGLTGGKPGLAYFLAYGDPAIKRISYAASFGGAVLSPEHRKEIAGYLEKFDHLSVREAGGKKLVKELIGRDAKVVLDPTLLVEDWSSISRPIRKANSYVLLYRLQKSPEVFAAATEMARRLGKPLLNVDASLKFWTRPGRCVRPASPEEWIGLFQNAAAVVTNSFHGTVFSVLFHRPFFSISLTGEQAGRAGRMRDLCAQLGLEERFVSGAAPLPVADVDWGGTDERLQDLRRASLDDLNHALKD